MRKINAEHSRGKREVMFKVTAPEAIKIYGDSVIGTIGTAHREGRTYITEPDLAQRPYSISSYAGVRCFNGGRFN